MPRSYEELVEQENTPARFKKIFVTFKDENIVLGTVQLSYGDSLDESGYPELPAKDGCAARWDTTELDAVHVDTVVEAVYTDYITALSSANEREDGRAVLFAKGQFGDRDSLTAALQDAPEDLHNVEECWLVHVPDDGLESHMLRYLPLNADAKYKVYAKLDGAWKALDTETIGSYLAFEVPGNEFEIAVVQTNSMMIWIIVAAGAAVVVLLAVLVIAKKKRKNKAKPAPAEEAPAGNEPQ